LMIGELNRVEQGPGAGAAAAAVPLPEALKVLLAAAASNKLPDALRAAAMVGIMRHAEAKIQDADDRKSLTKAMLGLVADDPPTGPAAPGRRWILAQAVETLGLLRALGEENAVYKAMLKIVSETKLPLGVRCVAAESLGRLNYSGAAGIDPVEAASALGQLAIDACAEELARTKSATTGPVRQRLVQRLDAILVALKAIAPLAQAPQQPFVAELQKKVTELRDLLDDNRRKEDNMKPQVETLRKNLEAWLQKKPA